MISSSLHLKFQKCPLHPFVGQPFDIELWLVNDSGKLQLRHEVPFTINLGFEGDSDSKCDSFLEVVGGTRKIEANGKCQLKVRLLDVSASFGDARFVLQASPLLSEHSLVGRGFSSPMVCVRHRLVVENRSQLPSLWYKDKGGKQNCIEIVVKLSDEKGQAVRRQIPLKLQLCYSPTGDVVNRPNILEISRDTKLQINEDGFATLRVRINEVSMRHDGKAFSFYISPDTLKDPNCADVGSITCSHVEVRSKITLPKNKRGYDEMNDHHHHPVVPLVPGPASHVAAPVLPHPNYQTASSHHPEPLPESISNKKQRMVRFSEEPQVSASTFAVANSKLTDDLIQWSQTVMDTLNRMKWTETGLEKVTERTVEGASVEISRPVFAISNPNELIEELKSSYAKLSQVHPELPCRSSSLDSLGNAGCSSPFNFCGSSDAIDPSSFIDFSSLPPLDANYPENSLSWGIIDSWTGAG